MSDEKKNPKEAQKETPKRVPELSEEELSKVVGGDGGPLIYCPPKDKTCSTNLPG